MAVEILKPGKDPKDQWVHFECDRCGCEFRVTMDETDQTYIIANYCDDYAASYMGDCPNCGKRLCGSLVKEC